MTSAKIKQGFLSFQIKISYLPRKCHDLFKSIKNHKHMLLTEKHNFVQFVFKYVYAILVD